jgi:methylmalonyl-CoA mutase
MTSGSSPADAAQPVAPPQEPTIEQIALESGEAHTRADWEKAAAAVLRKARRLGEDEPDELVWDRLATTTLDGIAVTPLGTPALTESLATAGRPTRSGAWDVRAHSAETVGAAANEALLADLDNGASSLWIEVGAHALPIEDLGAALKGVLLDVAPVVLDAPAGPLAAAQAFAELAGSTTVDPRTNLGADPIGAHLRRFNAGTPDDDAGIVPVAAIARKLGCRAVVADGTAVHDQGASDVQELAYALEVATTYLRLLVDAGHSIEEAAALIEFRVAATDEQFPTIAKLRALRRLWARVLELSGLPTSPDGSASPTSPTAAPRSTAVHAVTSTPMMTRYDPWVNMLRTCVAAFAAGVGGADAVTVVPFDARLGVPDGFARRIARNTSALLVEEAHVATVTDPAGGSYLVEKLTDDLAAAAWAEFGVLDVPGGLHVSGDAFAARVRAVAATRSAQVARRERPITGLSEFPNLHESLPERPPHPAGRAEPVAYGAAFEALRDDPPPQPVFLATMGTVAAHTARASFATNLLAAGGVDVVNAGRTDDVDAVLAAYDGQPVVCLAGSDAAYSSWGAELVAALRAAGARWVVLAGKSGDKTVAADLVDDTCGLGGDALDFLHRTRAALTGAEGEGSA